jgi:penicillin amidase
MSRQKSLRKWVNLGLALTVGGGLIYGLSHPVGPAPSLADVMNPSKGVWQTAANTQLLPRTEEIKIPGVQKPVQVLFEKDGTVHVKAEQNRDAWVAIGYLHAKHRLFEMDMLRRQARGQLAEVVGRDALEIDKFQRQLGLARTAKVEWERIQKSQPETMEMLVAYAEGVNAVIESSEPLPLMCQMLGYRPAPWTPEDSLVIKGQLTQTMSLSSTPVYYDLLVQSFGLERTMKLFPVHSPTRQFPYDEGPYQQHPIAPLPVGAEQILQQASGGASETQSAAGKREDVAGLSNMTTMSATLRLLDRLASLPPMLIDQEMNSNAWVVDGTLTASGKPMLAGDPHLDLTLPSVWYQVQVEAPDYKFAGVTVPGLPLALIGYNEDIAWSMTNSANQQTYYYKEKTDPAHPDQYYWQGAWHPMYKRTETIYVKGESPIQLEVKSTVHGPLISEEGISYSLNWLGAMPSDVVDGLRQIMRAKNFDQFRAAFRDWRSPNMNFLYADRQGNIGALGVGTYPVFAPGVKPWLPLSGTGEEDFKGMVAAEDMPFSYNPPNHRIVSANQRQVGEDYPYYIGTTSHFDLGYRAQRINEMLAGDRKLTAEDFKRMQMDVTDTLATALVPALVQAAQGASLSPLERSLLDRLSRWDGRMTADSVEGSVWWTFKTHYALATFKPWWEAFKVPEQEHKSLGINQFPELYLNLHAWTLQDPTNEFFRNPLTNEQRSPRTLMLEAFHSAVEELKSKLGEDPNEWRWEKLHTRVIPSLTQIDALGFGPKGAPGDFFTPNYAGGLKSMHGPSFRMIVDFGTGQRLGIYPGGQSENPISPWYRDRIEDWWNGEYRPMKSFDEALTGSQQAFWTLVPQN